MSDAGSATVKVWRDSLEVFQFSGDTNVIVYDSGLTPNNPYRYHAEVIEGNTVLATTDKLPMTTMDTTSQNFTWVVDAVGGNLFSELNDVFILDENNIWTVGEIHTAETDRFDSLGELGRPV